MDEYFSVKILSFKLQTKSLFMIFRKTWHLRCIFNYRTELYKAKNNKINLSFRERREGKLLIGKNNKNEKFQF